MSATQFEVNDGVDGPLCPATKVKSITYDDYLKLCGLLKLCQDHYATLKQFGATIRSITGEVNEFGHSDDAVYNGGSAADLLCALDIPVPKPPTGDPGIVQ